MSGKRTFGGGVVTASEISPAAITHGFDFARRQRDPEFRRYLTKIGWRPDHDIVIARDEEPVLAVLARIVYNETSSPCLIVIPNDKEAFGFRFLFAAVEPPRRDRKSVV